LKYITQENGIVLSSGLEENVQAILMKRIWYSDNGLFSHRKSLMVNIVLCEA